MSPASGDWTNPSADTLVNISQVSIQLMSPASGDLRHARPGRGAALEVSIQLMSPASGDGETLAQRAADRRFHSINVPSEWGQVGTGCFADSRV